MGKNWFFKLRSLIWKKLLNLPISYYDNNRSGDISSRIVNDVQMVKGAITDQLITFITGFITIVGSICALFIIDTKLTSVLLLSSLIILLVILPFNKLFYLISKNIQNMLGKMNTQLTQTVSSIKLVKSSNTELIETKKLNNIFWELARLGIKDGKIQSLLSPILSLVSLLMMVVVIGYGSIRLSTGNLSIGSLTAFSLYMFQLLSPLTQVVYVVNQFQRAKGSADRIFEVLKYPEEIKGNSKNFNLNCGLKIKHLNFGYSDTKDILHDINCNFDEGKTTAIVGPSGSGKTTLFALLERFYDTNQDNIYIGEVPIKKIDIASWRRKLGYVSQDTILIDGTILDNIVYGTQNKSSSQIQNAIKNANLREFINSLPDKLNTKVGENGTKLSGGQKQRIGIARVLLRDPDILLFDEATSSLDSLSERSIQKALESTIKNKTTIIIAHRLATVKNANKILFLDKGKITGFGTHEYLQKNHKKYRDFVKYQLTY